MKIIGIIMVILTSAAAGAAMAEALLRRCILLGEIDRLLEKSLILIKSKSSDFADIIYEVSCDERISDLTFTRKVNERINNGELGFREIWKECLMGYKPDYIKNDEFSLLCDFGETLGSTDTDGQLQRLSGMREQLKSIRAEAEKNYREKGKVYRALGVTAGLFAAVILI